MFVAYAVWCPFRAIGLYFEAKARYWDALAVEKEQKNKEEL